MSIFSSCILQESSNQCESLSLYHKGDRFLPAKLLAKLDCSKWINGYSMLSVEVLSRHLQIKHLIMPNASFKAVYLFS